MTEGRSNLTVQGAQRRKKEEELDVGYMITLQEAFHKKLFDRRELFFYLILNLYSNY